VIDAGSSLGYNFVHWGLDSSDWRWKHLSDGRETTLKHVSSSLNTLPHNGPIVLQHDTIPMTQLLEPHIIDAV
jgi:peptidoglycan/xylan/chitin deacetylase (PgdA/CDA1 family)